MPPVPKEIRESHEAAGEALSDMGHALTLLHLVLEQMADRPAELESLGYFLTHLLQDRHREAEAHMVELWKAVGGR